MLYRRLIVDEEALHTAVTPKKEINQTDIY